MLHKPIHTQNKARSRAHSKAWLLYVCLLTMLAGCSKCNKVVEPAGELSKLPAATQTGAGTFGCMVNGKAWMPQGRGNILGPANPTIVYDATYDNGSLDIRARIYAGGSGLSSGNAISIIEIYGSKLDKEGEYNLTNSNVRFAYSTDTEGFYSKEDLASNCKLTITKLDKVNAIISATFSFTIEKKDTGKKLTVTDGRFDSLFY